MPSRALLLQNPRARRGDEGPDGISSQLRSLGIDLIVEPPGSPARFPLAIRSRLAEIDRVIVAGGDGTINAAVQVLVEVGLPLGIIPMGTANNLARTLRIPTDPAGACEVIAAGYHRKIDLGRVNDRYFCTTASLGLSVRITEELSSEIKRKLGRAAYAVAALRALRRARPFRADITWDGGRRLSRTVQIVVGNGRYYGAALAVAEDAAIDDARLDLYTLEVDSWWDLVRLVPALKRGTHGERDEVGTVRATGFEIRTRKRMPIDLDGELGSQTPARVEVVPQALDVYCPTKIWG